MGWEQNFGPKKFTVNMKDYASIYGGICMPQVSMEDIHEIKMLFGCYVMPQIWI